MHIVVTHMFFSQQTLQSGHSATLSLCHAVHWQRVPLPWRIRPRIFAEVNVCGTSQMYWKTYYNGFNRYIVYHRSNMIWFRLITNNPSMKKNKLFSASWSFARLSPPAPWSCGNSQDHFRLFASLCYCMWRTCEQLISRTVVWQTAVVLPSCKILRRSWTCKTWLIIKAPTSKVWDIIWYYEMLSTQGTSGHLSSSRKLGIACCPSGCAGTWVRTTSCLSSSTTALGASVMQRRSA